MLLHFQDIYNKKFAIVWAIFIEEKAGPKYNLIYLKKEIQ